MDVQTNIFAAEQAAYDIIAWSETYGHRARAEAVRKLIAKAESGLTLTIGEALESEITHFEIHGSGRGGDSAHFALKKALSVILAAVTSDSLPELVAHLEKFQ